MVRSIMDVSKSYHTRSYHEIVKAFLSMNAKCTKCLLCFECCKMKNVQKRIQ